MEADTTHWMVLFIPWQVACNLISIFSGLAVSADQVSQYWGGTPKSAKPEPPRLFIRFYLCQINDRFYQVNLKLRGFSYVRHNSGNLIFGTFGPHFLFSALICYNCPILARNIRNFSLLFSFNFVRRFSFNSARRFSFDSARRFMKGLRRIAKIWSALRPHPLCRSHITML